VDKDFGAVGHRQRVHLYIRRRGLRLCLAPPAVDGQDRNHSEMSYDSYLS
jgi:hypothetical protein